MKKIFKAFRSQKGGMRWTIIILVIAIGFGSLLAGGSILSRGQAPSPDYSSEMMPIEFVGTPVTTHIWSINIGSKTCRANGNTTEAVFKVDAVGPTTGYILLEIAIKSGGFERRVTRPFITPEGSSYELVLPNDLPDKLGYNKHSWRVSLFQGGKKEGFYYTGGIKRVSILNNPTNCTP